MVDVKATTRYLVLHAASSLLVNSSQVLDSATNQELEVKRAFSYKPYEFWVLDMSSPIKASSKVKLHFQFGGPLATDMAGLYKSEYFDPTSERLVKLAATQFQVGIYFGYMRVCSIDTYFLSS